MSAGSSPSRLNLIQIGILILGLATALIHLVLLNYLMGTIDVMFTLNGLGYLALIAAYFTPQLVRWKTVVRWSTIAYAILTIMAWFILGDQTDPIGILTKLIEVGLIILLILDGRKAK